jgi:hypothetical protein
MKVSSHCQGWFQNSPSHEQMYYRSEFWSAWQQVARPLDCYVQYQICHDLRSAIGRPVGCRPAPILDSVGRHGHTVLQKPCTGNGCITDLEDGLEEPSSLEGTSVLPLAQKALGCSGTDTTKSSISQPMKARKKIWNSLAAKQDVDIWYLTRVHLWILTGLVGFWRCLGRQQGMANWQGGLGPSNGWSTLDIQAGTQGSNDRGVGFLVVLWHLALLVLFVCQNCYQWAVTHKW